MSTGKIYLAIALIFILAACLPVSTPLPSPETLVATSLPTLAEASPTLDTTLPETPSSTFTPTPTATATDTLTATPAPTGTASITASATASATSSPSLTPFVPSTSLEIDSYLASLAATNQFTGSALVAWEGQLLLSKGYGLSDHAYNIANTPGTRLKIGSVTKQFTAVAILKLQDSGWLNVMDPICTYLDDCPVAWSGITLHHLLTHTSGIPDYFFQTGFNSLKYQPTSFIDLLALFKDKALWFTPGSSWDYSNSNYLLLGWVIEQVSGQPYCTFLQQNIFTPLGMASSACAPGPGGLAVGYTGLGNDWMPMTPLDPSVLSAAGVIYSTVEDMFRWDRALYTDQLLPRALRDLMFTAHASGRLGDYGYGWLISWQFGQPVHYHPGGIDGFASFYARYPDEETAIILLSNRDTTDVHGIADTIASMVLGR